MKSLLRVLALFGVMVGTAAAQVQDARSVLQAAANAMGVDKLKSVQYSGKGWTGLLGQSHSPNTDWPRVDVVSYTRTIDYDTKSSKEEMVLVQNKTGPYDANWARGGGGIPVAGDQQRVVSMASGGYAWNMQGNTIKPAPADAELRQLEISLTPHGFLKSALAASNPIAVSRVEKGAIVTVVSIVLGKYRINGMISGNWVERIETWVPHPVLGDMLYETRYSIYKDFGGVMFPTRIHVHQEGDAHRDTAGANILDIIFTDIKPNVNGAALTVPDAVRQAVLQPARVESKKIADGVWLLGGGTHNSVAVEFRDFVAVVEAPLNEERSLAVIGEVNKLVPSKRIKYLVNTHHHFDHSGGIRTYAALGATIVTHFGNLEFFRQQVITPVPRTLMPDLLSLQQRIRGIEPVIETVAEKYVLSDGVRTMDIYQLGECSHCIANRNSVETVEALKHSANMLIAYLPKEKIVVEADLYSPPDPGEIPSAKPSQSDVAFYDNMRRLNLDVSLIAPIHGRVGTMEEFVKFVEKADRKPTKAIEEH